MNDLGYRVLDLNGDAVFRLRARLCGLLGWLENFAPEEELTDVQVRASKRLHGMWEWKEMLEENADELRAVAGNDLLFQREPYLRIARSGRREDNIGIHRDTHYGASAHEWVLWVPLTDAKDGAELRILPGSHLEPEEAYPWTQESADCERGSDKHWLGFRYAPKRMSAEVEAQTVPIQVRIGQALIFNSACVHGQIVNSAPWTRVSVDIRLVDASSPVTMVRGLHGNLYEPLKVAA